MYAKLRKMYTKNEHYWIVLHFLGQKILQRSIKAILNIIKLDKMFLKKEYKPLLTLIIIIKNLKIDQILKFKTFSKG